MHPRAERAPAWSAALCTLLCACAGTIKPTPERPELRNLTIEGNHALSDGDIEGKIATTEDSWLPFTDARLLDRAVLQTDLKRIVRLYEAHGYFDAAVTGTDVTPAKGKQDLVDVVIKVNEGEPTRISTVALQGADALRDDVKKRLTRSLRNLKAGEVFDEADYEAAKTALEKSLRNHGYATGEVNGEVKVDPKAHTAAVTFTMQPGARYHFGRVLVSGTKNVPREKISKEVASVAEPGELYSERKLQRAQNRVFDMGVFSLAKVTRGAPDPKTGEVPVAVDVTEAPFRTLRLGVGFGIERYREEIRGQGEYINRNFFGGLRKLDWDNRLAYVVEPDIIALFRGTGTQGVAGYSKATFTQPDLFLNDLDLSLTTQLERDIEVGFTDNSALAGVGLDKHWGRTLDVLVQYNFQVLQLNSLVDPRQLAQSRAPQLATSCSDPSCFLILSFLEQRVTLDLRDHPMRPRLGLYAALDLQEGGGPGSSFQYLRVEPEVRGYVPLGKRLVLAARLHWGWMKSLSSNAGRSTPTPLTQRFFGGGADDVRAYGSHLMSPVAVVCRDTNPNVAARHCAVPDDFQAVPVGGDGLYEASTELRIELTRSLGLVAFVDAGVVPISPFNIRAQDIAVAPGLGLRYFTLFGPVRLDFAYRLPSFGPDDGQLRLAPSQVVVNYPPASGMTFVSPGDTGRFDFQFSIGEAF